MNVQQIAASAVSSAAVTDAIVTYSAVQLKANNTRFPSITRYERLSKWRGNACALLRKPMAKKEGLDPRHFEIKYLVSRGVGYSVCYFGIRTYEGCGS